MINLRYHIVSIVAVFLALGIGLALGSTFVDSVLVSNLESQVNQLEEDTVAAVAERDAAVEAADVLRDEAAELEALGTPLLTSGRLGGRNVVIVAPDTVDRAAVDEMRDRVVASDAAFGGVLWFTNSFDLEDGPVRTALAEEFALAGDSVAAIQRALTFLMTQALFAPESAGTSRDGTPRVLTVLRDDGLLVYDPSFGGGPISGIGRSDLDLVVMTDADAVTVNDQILFPLMRKIADEGFTGRLILAELDSGTQYGSVLASFRSDPDLAPAFSSVDGIDTFEGLLAFAVALDRLPEVGHYGRLDSALARLPG